MAFKDLLTISPEYKLLPNAALAAAETVFLVISMGYPIPRFNHLFYPLPVDPVLQLLIPGKSLDRLEEIRDATVIISSEPRDKYGYQE